MSSSECMRIAADDADRIVKDLMADYVTAQAKAMRGGCALAVLLDAGLPTERSVIVNADGEHIDLGEAGIFASVTDVVHYTLEAECCCAERSNPDAEFTTTSPLCPVHGATVGAPS
jgi:hypothetical protein